MRCRRRRSPSRSRGRPADERDHPGHRSGDAIGGLPPSTCKQTIATIVTCTAPAAGISGVVFQTYPNQKALYAAYTAKVTALNTNKFRQNFNDCGSQDTFGEVGGTTCSSTPGASPSTR